MSIPRFFVDLEVKENRELSICGDTAHHIAHSLRLKKNEKLVLINPDGKEYLCAIEKVERRQVKVKIIKQFTSNTESPVHVALGISLLNTSKLDNIIRHVTELGITEVIPFQAERSQLKCHHVKNRRERWQQIVKNASQQSGRGKIPIVSNPVLLGEILKKEFTLKLISWEKERRNTLRNIYEANKEAKSIIVLIGPEGGFTEAELKEVIDKGFLPFSLGPRILRSETAALVSVALVQHYWGDLGIFS